MDIKPLCDLSGNTFIIPPYQRGYRWEAEQIKALLDDLKEFGDANYNDTNVFYCLQPIVVVPDPKLEKTFVVVDGQQRLTTIYLICHYLAQRGFDAAGYVLSLPGRDTQDVFLNKSLFADSGDTTYKRNIDNFYLRRAYDTISDWFSTHRRQEYIIADILMTAAKDNPPKAHAAVIWHKITDADALTSFRNLNFGKIPLGTAEIIKALLLQTDCYTEPRDIELARRRAGEWERMCLALSDPQLRGMFGDNSVDMLDTVLSFVADNLNDNNKFGFTRKPDNTYNIDLFNYYVINHFIKSAGKSKRSEASDDVWRLIQETVNKVSNWYSNRTWYHMIGAYSLVSGTTGIALLKKMNNLSKGKDKIMFAESLRELIGSEIRVRTAKYDNGKPLKKEQQGLNSPELNYDDNKDKIRKILTVFNVWVVENDSDRQRRFPFGLFRDFKITSLDHIHPQQIQDASRAEYIEWLVQRQLDIDSLDDSMKTAEVADAVNNLVILLVDDDTFNNNHDKVAQNVAVIDKLFGDLAQIKPEELHHIKNLALVDQPTNSALQNYFLDSKRDILIDRDRRGVTYMTPATENVFSKKYSAANPGNMNFWTKNDRDAYLAQLQTAYHYFTKKA